ncbi:hypothetical protein VNO80_10866 [Phaseolus coccineus]|uniref:Uncharacterized protein n=1 Tax=Phaseolus coccineus TaxID=3886 RepID=A0AAN9N902_PHACN
MGSHCNRWMVLCFVIAISFSGMMERAVAARHLMQISILPPFLSPLLPGTPLPQLPPLPPLPLPPLPLLPTLPPLPLSNIACQILPGLIRCSPPPAPSATTTP